MIDKVRHEPQDRAPSCRENYENLREDMDEGISWGLHPETAESLFAAVFGDPHDPRNM